MPPIITEPGAYHDVSAEEYHRAPNLLPGPSISSSGLKTMLGKSPAHYWWDSPLNPNRPPEKEKPHFSVGKAAHDMLLLTDRWPEAYYVLAEDFSAQSTKKQKDQHAARDEARDAGKVILTWDQAETVRAMAAGLQSNPAAVAALTNGEPEVTLAWQDPETEVWLRCRPDFLPHKRRIVPDLKTAADASPAAFQRAISNFGYHQSAALYMDGIKAIFGAHPEHWIHIVLEKEQPYRPALYPLPAEDIERGRWLNRKAIRLFARCLNEDHWPGYADDPVELGLPGWSRKQIDDGITPEGSAWAEAA
jgi:hypothetical protein